MFAVSIFTEINIAPKIYITKIGFAKINVWIHFVDTITSITYIAKMDATLITHTAFLIYNKGIDLLTRIMRKINHLLT